MLAADEDLQEGRPAGYVRPDEPDPVPSRQLEVDVREREAAAVGLRDALEPKDTGAGVAGAEGEADRPVCYRKIDLVLACSWRGTG